MNQFRLEQLRNFYEEEPNDPFNVYALATELLKFDLQAATKCFRAEYAQCSVMAKILF